MTTTWERVPPAEAAAAATTWAQPPQPYQPVSVGRWVHYVSAGSADGRFPSVCRAALVTEVAPGDADQKAGLMVVNPEGVHFRPLAGGGVRYCAPEADLSDQPYTWHWPERV